MAASPRITEEGEDLFRVELGGMGKSTFLGSVLSKSVRIDPFQVASALLAVLSRCEARSALGQRLLWNDFRLFLSPQDHERLRSLEVRLNKDLHVLLHQEAQRMGAELVGPLSVHLLVDESGELPAGSVQIRASFLEGPGFRPQAARAGQDSTVRAGQEPVEVLATPIDDTGSTSRVLEPDSAPALQLTWPGGGVLIPSGPRVSFGRPHEPSPALFVPLPHASPRVSRRHFWIEAQLGPDQAPRALVGRFTDANPLQVQGRLVQPGGSLSLERLPVEISLSSGEMILVLEEPVRG